MFNPRDFYNPPVLQSISNAVMNEAYSADFFAPTVRAPKRTGNILTFGNNHLKTYRAERTAWDEGEHRIDFAINKDKTYKITSKDLTIRLTDVVYKEVGEDQKGVESLYAASTRTITESLKLYREKSILDVVTNASVITRNRTLSGTDKWNDYSNSTPFEDIEAGCTSVLKYTGKKANRINVPYEVYAVLKNHPDFRNEIGRGMVIGESEFVEILKRKFGFTKVNIAQTIEDTAVLGQTSSLSFVWGDKVQIFYAPENPDIFTPAFMYNYVQDQDQMIALYMEAIEKRNGGGDAFTGVYDYDDAILNSDACYLLIDVL